MTNNEISCSYKFDQMQTRDQLNEQQTLEAFHVLINRRKYVDSPHTRT